MMIIGSQLYLEKSSNKIYWVKLKHSALNKYKIRYNFLNIGPRTFLATQWSMCVSELEFCYQQMMSYSSLVIEQNILVGE